MLLTKLLVLSSTIISSVLAMDKQQRYLLDRRQIDDTLYNMVSLPFPPLHPSVSSLNSLCTLPSSSSLLSPDPPSWPLRLLT